MGRCAAAALPGAQSLRWFDTKGCRAPSSACPTLLQWPNTAFAAFAAFAAAGALAGALALSPYLP